MKRPLLCVALVSCFAAAGAGCQSQSPVSYDPALRAAPAMEPPLLASAETFRLGAGDGAGLMVFEHYVAWVQSHEPLPDHLQVADASAPFILEAGEQGQQLPVLQTYVQPPSDF